MKTTPTERIKVLHRQIAYNLVQLAVRILACRRSPFSHSAHECYAYERALATQRNTLNWLPDKDRAAVIAHAKEWMKDERKSQKAVSTYRTLPHDTKLMVNGRRVLWCHVANDHAATVDVQEVAQNLKERGVATIGVGESAIEIRVEAATAVAA